MEGLPDLPHTSGEKGMGPEDSKASMTGRLGPRMWDQEVGLPAFRAGPVP